MPHAVLLAYHFYFVTGDIHLATLSDVTPYIVGAALCLFSLFTSVAVSLSCDNVVYKQCHDAMSAAVTQ